MQETINQRVLRFIKANNITVKNLSEVLNIHERTLAHKLSGYTRIDMDTLIGILTVYPDLSPDWLLFGRGTMTRGQTVTVEQNNIIGDNTATIGRDETLYKERVKHLEEMLAEKERLISVLMKAVNS